MPTYTKETALYDTGAIQSGIDGAAQTATSFITQITGGGIMVHPSGDSTSGWRIADALELIKSTVTAFSVTLVSGMAKVIVGEASKSHAEIDYHSLQLVDKDGETYFHVSDLRSGAYDTVTTKESFVATETGGVVDTAYYFTNYARASSGSVSEVKVNGSTATFMTIDAYIDVGADEPELLEVVSGIEITSALSAGDVINVTYEAIYGNLKAYTLGIRDEDGAVGAMSVAEGVGNVASGQVTHVEGKQCEATGDMSHAEGMRTKAQGYVSHAEGNITIASGDGSHTQNIRTRAMGRGSHAEGYETIARAEYSHAQGDHTIAGSAAQTVMGKYNVEDADDVYALIVGNGTATDERSNAFMVSWAGDVHCTGGPDRDETPSSTANGPGYRFVDALNRTIGRVFPRHNADANSVVIEAMRSVGGTMKYGQLYVGVTPAGDPWYYINGKAEFRETLGLGRTQGTLTLSNASSGTVTLVRNSIVASVILGAVKLSSALANGSSIQIATVPSGYRPAVTVHTPVYMNTNGFPHGIDAYVTSAGAVMIINRSGASLATTYNIYATLTYVI